MTPADISQTQDLQADPQLSGLVASRTAALCEEIDLAGANAAWGVRTDERGRKLAVLHLRDALEGEANKDFAPDELTSRLDTHFRERLRSIKAAVVVVGEWRGRLHQFYATVRQWLDQAQPPLFIEDVNVTLNEDRSGPYDVPGLDIRRGVRFVRVRPVGTWVVGAQGRIDLEGETARVILVVDGTQWFYVPDNRLGRPELITQDRFNGLVEALLG
jgi:hypothetical protein